MARVGRTSRECSAPRGRIVRAMGSFALFAAVQVALLVLGFVTFRRYCPDDGLMAASLIGLAALCLVVDVVLVVAMRRARSKIIDDARADALAGQLDGYLADYERAVDVMQRSARIRHDMRNQVQVVNALAERGEFELAEHHIDAMMRELGE